MQKSGSLYKRGAQSSAWQQRQVTLNIDTGILKFFAEKSGNRIPKGQVCIKDGKLKLLDSADIGHQYAFEVRMEDMVGKSDDAVQTLSVDTQEQLDQWVEWIELTFATERRKSTKSGETRRPSSSENLTESFKWSVVPGVPKKPDSFKKSIVSSLFQTVESEDEPSAAKSNELISAESTVLSSTSADPAPDLSSPNSAPSEKAVSIDSIGIAESHSPLTLDIGEETSKNTNNTVVNAKQTDFVLPVAPTTELVPLPLIDRPKKPLTRRPSKSSARDLFAQNDDESSTAVPAIPPHVPGDTSSPDGKNLAAKLEAKLNARQSFKPPNFKNLLNSNGFDLSSRRSQLGSETASETDSMAPSGRTTNNGTPVPSLPPTPNVPNDSAGMGAGIAGQKNSARRSTVTPSPSLENIYVESGEVSPLLLNGADAIPARRSFTKSPARRRASKKVTHLDTQTAAVAGGNGESDTSRPHTPSHALTRHLNIKTRPTETVRTGSLYKLDTSHSHEAGAGDDLGQDVWLTQFVSLDVTTGNMLIFSEINGKRFQRAKFDINLCSVKSIDQLFHSRLYSFKITYKPEDPAEKKITAVFAAENEDALHYWLASFEDCEEHFHNKHLTAMAAAAGPAPVSAASSPARPAPSLAVSASAATAEATVPLVVASTPAVVPAAAETPTPAPSTTAETPAKFDARAALAAALAKRRASKTGDVSATPEPARESPSPAPVALEEAPPSPPSAPSVPLNPLAAALQARFASAPSVFRKQEPEPDFPLPPPPAPPADESPRLVGSGLESRSHDGLGERQSSDMHLMRVNTLNMDQMLSMDLQFDAPPPLPYTPMGQTPANSLPFSQNNMNTVLVTMPNTTSNSPTPTPTEGSAAEAPFSVPKPVSATLTSSLALPVAPVAVPAALAPPAVDLSAVKFSVQRVKYPAERLSRRIKIWYCSSGFSLSTAAEVEHFVKELRNAGDAVLTAFSEEKFDELQDWANLLAMLRKYEQKWAVTSPADPAKRLDGIAFDVTSASRSALIKTKSTFTLKANLDMSGAAKQLSKEMNATEAAVMEALPAALLSKKDDSVISQGLGLLNDDLTFAEDLLLYQEEVINHLWNNFMDQKALLENRDETIVKLHAKVGQLESAANNNSAVAGGATPSAVAKKSLSSISHPLEPATSWEAEKNQLVKAHYEAKAKLINEIQTLRKALTPTGEQTFKDLRKSEFLRAALEEEVVNAHIHNDNLKAEIAALKDKVYEAEDERSAMEAHWSEQIEKLKKEHDHSIKQLQKDVDKATQQAAKVKEEARKALMNGTAVVTSTTNVNTHASSATAGGVGGFSAGAGSNASRGASPAPFTMVSYTTDASPHPQAAQSGAFSPASFNHSDSNGVADAAKVVKIVSRFSSPTRDENSRHTNKTYVNAYSHLQDTSSNNGSSLNSSTKSNTSNNNSSVLKAESPKVFLPYNYSSEFKEGADDAALQQQRFDQFLHSMPLLPPTSVPTGHAAQQSQRAQGPGQGQSVNPTGYFPSGSVGSLRRDELVDPEDDEDEVQHFHPASSQSQPRPPQSHPQGGVRPSKSTGALSASYTNETLATTGTSGKHNRPPNLALQASLRSQRLPPSASNHLNGAHTPMTPGTRMTGPFSSAPASPANPLLVSRSAFNGQNQNPIRAAIRSEVAKQQQQPVSSTTGGAYIAPHNTKYTVKPTEDSARTRAGTPGMGSGPPSPSVGYMSATKSTMKQHQLTKDSAKDSFYKKYIYENN